MPKKKSGTAGETNISSELNSFIAMWGRIVSNILLILLYSIILAYVGFFNLPAVLLGILLIVIVSRSYLDIANFWWSFWKKMAENLDVLKFMLVLVWVIWFFFLLFYAPFPAFSGRDEGSYANAAIYLAKFGSINFQLPLLDYLKNEGLAHQLLNYPGFVINSGHMASQFSPAYFVFLGIFFLIIHNPIIFFLANGALILGGGIAFYFLLRLFFPRWVSLAGLLLLLFNFLFIWFSRFTLSENLAFFLFSNLLLFLVLFRLSSENTYLLPILLSVIIFPLTRPEGWWLLIATVILLYYWYNKRIITLAEDKAKKLLLLLTGGLIFSVYAIFGELPIYKRLIRDWLEWPSTSQYYGKIIQGTFSLGDVKEIFLPLFPSLQRFIYFVKVEWNYGVLIFGIFALLAFIIFIWDRKKEFFSFREHVLISIVMLLSLPFFIAFLSPQISPDHPWMLRRFLFVVLPVGVIFAILLGINFIKRYPSRWSFSLVSIFLALLLLPSLSAATYFLTVRTDEGREAILKQLGNYFKKDDFIFLQREASGDGWHMWAEPLSSLYGLNAVYIYNPSNILDIKEIINNRFSEGKRNFVILPDQAYDYEHELQKEFNLSLDQKLTFDNLEFDIDRSLENTNFPLLEKKEYSAKIYLLSPR